MDIIGQITTLPISDFVDFGAYLDGGPYGRILLPKRALPEDAWEGDDVEVFIYFDSEDRIIATTETPKITANTFACLKARHVNSFGAFMDWGVTAKDLLVPFKEQKDRLQEGQRYIVYCYVDKKTNRLVGSTRLNKFLSKEPPTYEVNDKVDIIVAEETDLGYNCIINKTHMGLLFKSEIFQNVHIGMQTEAFIKNVRADLKIDLILKQKGFKAVITGDTGLIISKLEENGGQLPYHDKSDPEAIYAYFGISKKAFKKACGSLYKDRKIVFTGEGIKLTDSPDS